MAALFDEIVALLASRATVRSIANDFPGADVPSLGTAAVLGVPAIVARLSESLGDQAVSDTVLQHLRGIDPASVTVAGSTADPAANRVIGTQLTELAFGKSGTNRVTNAVAAETGISQANAAAILPTSAWAVIASVARRYGNQLDNTSLTAILSRERQDLAAKGWSQWIDNVAAQAEPPAASASPQVENRRRPSTDQTPAIDLRPPEHRAPEPQNPGNDRRAGATAIGATAGIGAATPRLANTGEHQAVTFADSSDNTTISDGTLAAKTDDLDRFGRGAATGVGVESAPTRSGTHRVERPHQIGDEPRREVERPRSGRRGGIISLIAGALLMLIALAGIGWLQSRGDSTEADGSTAVAAEDDTTGTDTTGTATTDTSADASQDSAPDVDTTGVGPDETEVAAPPGVLLDYSIEMNDPLERSNATGLINLTFEPEANQVCYDVMANGIGEPYDGHIHVGPAGVKGGIVIDFGPLSNGQTACTEVAANDMNIILSQPAVHYVEMHDPSGDFTIRAQMSDAPPPPPPPGPVNFNPDGNGAVTKISAGRIVLDGPVADRETMNRMIADVSGLDESRILVVNDLVITDGADLPTGLITVSDAILFEVDSDELDPASSTVLDDLALLFSARPSWTMTIVGHTDGDGTDVYNLELSLRRASAVRDALTSLGIPAERLRTEGDGATDPVASNETEEGRAQNRRIEFRIDRN